MCQIIDMSFFIATQKFYLCQVGDCLSFPRKLHAKGCSFWTSHTQNTKLSWFKKFFQPLKSFCRSDKAKLKPVVSKISRMGKSSNAVSFLFSVSGRWVRPWFHTIIGHLNDELISLLLLPESLRVLLLGQTRALFFKPRITCDPAPKTKREEGPPDCRLNSSQRLARKIKYGKKTEMDSIVIDQAFLACMFYFPILDQVMVPQRTVSFNVVWSFAREPTCICMHHYIKNKFPEEHHVVWIGKTKQTS